MDVKEVQESIPKKDRHMMTLKKNDYLIKKLGTKGKGSNELTLNKSGKVKNQLLDNRVGKDLIKQMHDI